MSPNLVNKCLTHKSYMLKTTPQNKIHNKRNAIKATHINQ